jgi:hypothetical protein
VGEDGFGELLDRSLGCTDNSIRLGYDSGHQISLSLELEDMCRRRNSLVGGLALVVAGRLDRPSSGGSRRPADDEPLVP